VFSANVGRGLNTRAKKKSSSVKGVPLGTKGIIACSVKKGPKRKKKYIYGCGSASRKFSKLGKKTKLV